MGARTSVTVALALVPILALAASGRSGGPETQTLVQLRTAAGPAAERALARGGAHEVVPELRLYRLPTVGAQHVLSQLHALHAVRYTALDREQGTLALEDEPLLGDEWWRSTIGIDGLEPPGPGVPVTVVDSGVDVTHPEFAARTPAVLALNPQEPAGVGGRHGTGVASVIGAPVNGEGIAGIYPQAELRSWDAALGEGRRLQTSEIVGGILAAARRGRGVVNLSLGGPGPDPLIRQAVAAAVRRDVLVVAASGNDGPGGPVTYPAGYPHVLTVGATGREDTVAPFSSTSRFVDLVAPGTDMTTAWPINASESPTGYQVNDGTSFSAPLVSGAAAWVWTVRPDLDATQLFEIMRRSARDIGPPGRDDSSGFGILDVGAALSAPAPVRDPLEPNETPLELRPAGLARGIAPAGPLTTKTHRANRVVARLDAVEDPRDLYRVWVPRGATFAAGATATTDVDLSLWRGDATDLTSPASDRVARGILRGPDEQLTYVNRGPAAFFLLSVAAARGVTEAEYTLRVAARAV